VDGGGHLHALLRVDCRQRVMGGVAQSTSIQTRGVHLLLRMLEEEPSIVCLGILVAVIVRDAI